MLPESGDCSVNKANLQLAVKIKLSSERSVLFTQFERSENTIEIHNLIRTRQSSG